MARVFLSTALLLTTAVASSGENCAQVPDGGCDGRERDESLLLQLNSKGIEVQSEALASQWWRPKKSTTVAPVALSQQYGTGLKTLLGTSAVDILKTLVLTFVNKSLSFETGGEIGKIFKQYWCAEAEIALPRPDQMQVIFEDPADVAIRLEISPIEMRVTTGFKNPCEVPEEPTGTAVTRVNMTFSLYVEDGTLQVRPWDDDDPKDLDIWVILNLPGFLNLVAPILQEVIENVLEEAFINLPAQLNDLLKGLPKSISWGNATLNTSFTEVATVTKPGAPFGEPALGFGISTDVSFKDGQLCTQPWAPIPWFRQDTPANVSGALMLAVRPLNCLLDELYADGGFSFTMPAGKMSAHCFRFPTKCLKYGKRADVSLHVYPTGPVQVTLSEEKGIVGSLEYAAAWQVNGESMACKQTRLSVEFGMDFTLLFNNPVLSIGFRVSECKINFESVNWGMRDTIRDVVLNFVGNAACLLPERLVQAGAVALVFLPDVLAVSLQRASLDAEDGYVAAELTLDLVGDPKECTNFLPDPVSFVNCSYKQAFESGSLEAVVVPSDVPPAAPRQLVTGDWCEISAELCLTYGRETPMVVMVAAETAPKVSSGTDGGVDVEFDFILMFGVTNATSIDYVFTVNSTTSISVQDHLAQDADEGRRGNMRGPWEEAAFEVTQCEVKETSDSTWLPKTNTAARNLQLQLLCWVLTKKLLPPLSI